MVIYKLPLFWLRIDGVVGQCDGWAWGDLELSLWISVLMEAPTVALKKTQSSSDGSGDSSSYEGASMSSDGVVYISSDEGKHMSSDEGEYSSQNEDAYTSSDEDMSSSFDEGAHTIRAKGIICVSVRYFVVCGLLICITV